jgi:hypothetical protein
MPFCTLQICVKQNPAAIWAHMHPALEYLRDYLGFFLVYLLFIAALAILQLSGGCHHYWAARRQQN